MAIKMIATDMDDTLLTSTKEISKINREAIKKAVGAGLFVVLATGRMYEAALPFAQSLHLEVPLITYNGALVKNPVTGQVLYERSLNENVTGKILDYCKKNHIHVQIYWDGKIYTDELDDNSRWYAKIINQPVVAIGEELYNLSHRTYKLMCMVDSDRFRSCWEEIDKLFGKEVVVTSSLMNLVEVSAPGVDKWDAVKNLAFQRGIKENEIMCIGDNHNDVGMIKNAGTGVAVANAEKEVLAVADVIVAANNDNGVAEAVHIALVSD